MALVPLFAWCWMLIHWMRIYRYISLHISHCILLIYFYVYSFSFCLVF